jgi:hypothetical protein
VTNAVRARARAEASTLFGKNLSRCLDCGADLPVPASSDPKNPGRPRSYCDRCRERRAGISYLGTARTHVIAAGRLTDAAEIAEMIRRLEAPRHSLKET